MKTRLRYIETLFLSILLAILILPGMYLVNLYAHESYHAYKHSAYSEKICIDFGENTTFAAHTVVVFPNDTLKDYTKEMQKKEEKNANRVGKIVAIIYLVIFVLIIAWLLSLARRYEKEIKKIK